MSFSSLIRTALARSPRKAPPRKARIRLDSLEDRTTPAVGTIQFAANTNHALESASPTINVTLVTDLNNLNGTVSANVGTTGGTATVGADFNAFPTTTVTFANGDPFVVVGSNRVYTKSAPLSLIDDQRVEA